MKEFIFDCKNSKELEQLKLFVFDYENKLLNFERSKFFKEQLHVVITNYHVFENFSTIEKTNEVCPNFNTIFKNAYDVTAFVSSLNFILKQGRKINVSFERWSYSSNELDLHRKEIEEKIKKHKKDVEAKLVILPYFTSSVCANNAQLYFQFKKEEINGFYYMPFNLLIRMIKEKGKILSMDELMQNPKTFWSGNEFFEHKFLGKVDNYVLSNNQIPTILDYTKENCEKINQLNSIFLKEGENLEENGQIHFYSEDYVKMVEEQIVLF